MRSPYLQADLSSAVLLAAAEVVRQECLSVSEDYIQNPTLVKTLAASVAACLQAVAGREHESEVVKAANTALQAAGSLIGRIKEDSRNILLSGLLVDSLVILQTLDSGKTILSCLATGFAKHECEIL